MNAKDILHINKVIPVITIYNQESAINLAQALLQGGIKVLEITLRSEHALKAIELIVQALPEMVVGAGTVINEQQLKSAIDAGAKFAISPGINTHIAKMASTSQIPFIPGIATPGELMLALDYELECLKLFPAETIGGISMLKALYGPFEKVSFCPTGGINPQNASTYLKQPNVLCVGGSWLTPKDLILDQKWQAITELALQTQKL